MEAVSKQSAQPDVTQKKFDAEIAQFFSIEQEYRKRGIFCVLNKFPIADFVFVAQALRPSPIVFAAAIDFTNYDVEPPSVRFINPFSREPMKTKDLQARFFKVMPPSLGISLLPGQNVQPLLVGEPEDFPFLCIPGVREYHNHPQHTGNPWLLHRTKGEGTLGFLLDQLHGHCIPYVKAYNLTAQATGINYQL